MSETKNQETRKCEVCGEIKPVADFSKSYRNRCKPCVAEMCRNDRKSHNNPVEEKTSTLKWQTLNLTDGITVIICPNVAYTPGVWVNRKKK